MATGNAVLPVQAELDLRTLEPQFRRAKKKDGSWGVVHYVVSGIAGHDILQGTTPKARWPWGKDSKRVDTADFVVGPRCKICVAYLDDQPAPGYV